MDWQACRQQSILHQGDDAAQGARKWLFLWAETCGWYTVCSFHPKIDFWLKQLSFSRQSQTRFLIIHWWTWSSPAVPANTISSFDHRCDVEMVMQGFIRSWASTWTYIITSHYTFSWRLKQMYGSMKIMFRGKWDILILKTPIMFQYSKIIPWRDFAGFHHNASTLRRLKPCGMPPAIRTKDDVK